MRVLNLISFFMFFSNRSFKWGRASARNLGAGLLPARCIWQGSGFAADQTNAMLATSNGGDKTPVKGNPLRLSGITVYVEEFSICGREMKCFFIRLSRDYFPCTQCFFGVPAWGWYHYPRAAVAVSEQPRAGFISAEKRLSQSGCSAPTNALFPPAHSAFSALLCGGWYHYSRRALHAVETLDARGSRRRIRRFYAAAVLAMCGLNIPSAGTHATPAPNRAHSGSQGETRGLLSPGHSVALCCQRNCHRKNSRRKWMHASWRVSASSGTAAPLAVYLGGRSLNIRCISMTDCIDK